MSVLVFGSTRSNRVDSVKPGSTQSTTVKPSQQFNTGSKSVNRVRRSGTKIRNALVAR
ncbi:hypothetical protein HanRHA438_Chr08g0367491 [Helianthus annuus]|nr:hypothetical protein HanRHA438_Chr08g0367491 [Helianthus annuus]